MQRSAIAGAITELQRKARALILSDDLPDGDSTEEQVSVLSRGSNATEEVGTPS
jgi:hypothetical protein